MALFKNRRELDLHALRRKFMDARLAEDIYFGKGATEVNILMWLQHQCQAVKAGSTDNNDSSPWQADWEDEIVRCRPIEELFKKNGVELLREYAEQERIEYPWEDQQSSNGKVNIFDALMSVLDPTKIAVYNQPCGYLIAFPELGGGCVIEVDNQHDSGNNPLVWAHADDIMYALVAAWDYHDDGKEKVRAFLCNTLENALRDITKEAGADFDAAVAVSLDGLRIVHADLVVVVEGEKVRCFNSEVFREEKITLLGPESMVRLDIGLTKAAMEQGRPSHLAKMLEHMNAYQLVQMQPERILIMRPSQHNSPFPE